MRTQDDQTDTLANAPRPRHRGGLPRKRTLPACPQPYSILLTSVTGLNGGPFPRPYLLTRCPFNGYLAGFSQHAGLFKILLSACHFAGLAFGWTKNDRGICFARLSGA
jgi:hypothetical protein